MIGLDDAVWKGAEGGYHVPYDASVALHRFEDANDFEEEDNILDELWENLHHQGDVGLASYLAVPQLARIAESKGMFYWKLVGLCTVIESQRHDPRNPKLASEYLDYYLEGLSSMKRLVLSNLHHELDAETFQEAIAMLALCNGQVVLGRALSVMDEHIAKDLLEEWGYGS